MVLPCFFGYASWYYHLFRTWSMVLPQLFQLHLDGLSNYRCKSIITKVSLGFTVIIHLFQVLTKMRIVLLLLPLCLETVICYSNGKVEVTCGDMTPQHGYVPSPKDPPFTITADKSQFSPEDEIKGMNTVLVYLSNVTIFQILLWQKKYSIICFSYSQWHYQWRLQGPNATSKDSS